jgi:hypothetical protein
VATKRKPSKKQNAAARLRARSQRAAKVWDLFMRGVPMSTIATTVGCAPQTVKNDITDTEQALKELDALRATDTRERAVDKRRHLQGLALKSSEEADPKDRAPLYGEVRKNQDGIEKLQGLDPDEPGPPQANVYLFPLGDGSSPKMDELTREERAAAKLQIDAELEALPEPSAEEPAAEYTPVEEPTEPPPETPS